ncbi:MAG: beta-galactosidase GalA [Chitinophagaceae bacterium]
MKYLLYLCCFLFSVSIHAQQGDRNKISLDDDWRFQFGHAADPAKDFNYGLVNLFSKSGSSRNTAISPDFADSSWRKLDLPHDWAVELPFVNADNFDHASHGYKPVGGAYPATSIGWYRKNFEVNAADSGKRFTVTFDGIYRDAKIWLNGFYLGNNLSGYVGVTYDITDYINFRGKNTLVVRADATQYEGWFYEGAGIYRHVWLESFANQHIAENGLFVQTSVQGKNATVKLEMTIENNAAVTANSQVGFYVTDRAGNIIGRSTPRPVSIGAGKQAVMVQSLALKNIREWSLEDPYLYRVVATVSTAGRVVDEKKERFGIRTISINTQGLLLNGKHVKLLGTNNHQDHAGLGSALPDYLHYYRIGLLKNLGSNAYRTSHHAPAKELLEACDSLGMLVMDEQRLLNSSPEYLDQFERLIKRDRNHASVFMWSIGNEEGWIQTTSYGKRIAQTLLAKQMELDPSRTSTYAADLPNVFNGVNEVIPVRGFNYRHFAVSDYQKSHPAQPIIGTEMGSTVTTRGMYVKDSLRGYLPDQDITAPWWASRAEEWWPLAATNSYWAGGFVWTGFDYRGEPTPFQWPNINSHFGVMDVCGFPKNIYYYYQSWWSDKDVLHISPHWNRVKTWGSRQDTVDVWVNSNADDVELFLNGKSLGKKLMPVNGHLNWKVNYEPGKLEAIAFRKGRKITAKVETTGAPAEVLIVPYKTTMMADGKDVSIINVSVVDRQGREVPDADNLIQFKLEGDAKIIGVGNGDPSSHEADKCMDGAWQRRLFNGKNQVIVQSGRSASTIKFTASAVGLQPGSTDIVTVSPVNTAVYTDNKKFRLTGEQAKIRVTEKMMGADISFLPELEAKGVRFTDAGQEKDAISILKSHGFNYIRLRIFNDPAADSGYSPGKGFCDLAHTLQMAKRVKAAGMKLLLDFHYSDTWADPGKQFKPAAWKGKSFEQVEQELYDFTAKVMKALAAQGTIPDMVQVGNEINHGMVWPDGNIKNPDQLARLIKAGTSAVKNVAPQTIMLMHVALGGQHDESAFFIDQMLARGVHFDVIGESYYPMWHGTPDDLRDNLADLSSRYDRDVIVVEYSQLKDDVNRIAFDVPGGRGKGTCIWEPLSTWESIFDKSGKANELLLKYDELSNRFLK